MLMNFFFSVVAFLCISSSLKADHFDEKTAKIISLGGTCHTAIALRDLNFRKDAFPFDWVISTNHVNFIRILHEDFYNFLDESSFETINGIPTRLNRYYHLDFPHDFGCSEDPQAEWILFQEKYSRRIERFRSLRSYKGKVFFIRVLWSQPIENAQGQFQENFKRTLEIRDALDQYFPELDYTLVIWSHSDLDIPPLKPLERVIELKIPKAYYPFHDIMIQLLADRILM